MSKYIFYCFFIFFLMVSFNLTTPVVYAQSCCPSGQLCEGGACVIDIGTGAAVCTTSCVPISGSNPNFQIPGYIAIGESGFRFNSALVSQGIGAIGAMISELLPYVYVIAGLLLFFYLIYGGVHLFTSFCSPQAILEAWLIVFRALVG